MALNANDVASNGPKREVLDPGTYPGRSVAVVDLGLQPQRAFQGKDKPPQREIAVTYELADEFMKDEDGKEDKQKPRWVTETFPLHNLNSEKARSTVRYKTLDPDNKFNGDFAKCVDIPLNITLVQNVQKKTGKIFENVAGISVMRQKDAVKAPALVNKVLVFDLDAPDLETWKRVPKFLQDKIKANLEFKGSPLEKLLGPDAAPAKQPEKPDVAVEEEPPY